MYSTLVICISCFVFDGLLSTIEEEKSTVDKELLMTKLTFGNGLFLLSLCGIESRKRMLLESLRVRRPTLHQHTYHKK